VVFLSAMSRTDSGEGTAPTSIGALGTVAGLLLLTGWALPIAGGWVLPCAVVIAAGWLGTRARVSSDETALARIGASSSVGRGALVAASVLAGAVVVAVAARALGGVLVAFPAAWWSVLAGAAFSLATRRVVADRVRGSLGMVGVVVVAVAAILGTRFESGGVDARGWAHSGPVHGIHPFQATAIVVDGYGPFDLPINDYVEPDGSRGYDPEGFAEALEQALDRIAQVHFPEGPARAKMAFERAEVGAVVDAPIRERLDRDPPDSPSPRFFVRSGTFGQRSSVQFVCPGRRDDPRGIEPDNIMNRMCPDKYAAEASAGLGVTGRWPGYAEARGNERLGLSRLLGRVRSDDAEGRQVVAWEIRGLAWATIACVAVLGVWSPRATRAWSGLGGATALTVIAILMLGVAAMVLSGAQVPVSTVERGPPGPWSAWLAAPAVIVGVSMHRISGISGSPGRDAGGPWLRIGLAGVLTGTLAVALALPAQHWALGVGARAGSLPLQSLVEGVAEAIGPRLGLHILEIEGVVAGGVCVLLLTACAVAVRSATGVASAAALSAGGRWVAWASMVGVALALTLSRKTDGGSTFIPGAVGLGLVFFSAVVRLGRPRSSTRANLVHAACVGVGIAAVVASAAASVQPTHPFVLGCAVVGVVTAFAALAVRPPPQDSPSDVRA
jgi:hypothetical protein